MATQHIQKKNDERRYGTHCMECGKKLGRFRLDGVIDGQPLAFCSFGCHDNYSDKAEARRGLATPPTTNSVSTPCPICGQSGHIGDCEED